MHGAEAQAEAQILGIAQPALNAPATAVVPGQLLGGGIGAAGRKAPGLLHTPVLNTDHGSHRIRSAVTAAPRSTRAPPPARTQAAAVRVSPVVAVTAMLPRKRMT